MKRLFLLFICVVCLCSLSSFANSHYSTENNCEKSYKQPGPTSCFLCTNANMNTLFKQINLCETQICNAMKIQSKYEQEVLSLNERIECEKAALCKLEQNCSNGSEIRKQKRLIKKLEKKKKEICKCYEKQFKATLSKDQERAYNKNKKCK